MAAVVAVACQWKPHLATTAVACVLYSCLGPSLNWSLSDIVVWAQVSPSVLPCLLGLCVFPFGLAAYQASTGSYSPVRLSCKDGFSLFGSSIYASSQQKNDQQGVCKEGQAGSLTDTHKGSSNKPMGVDGLCYGTNVAVPLGSVRRQLYNSSSIKPRRKRLPRLSVELTPLPRLTIDFSSCRQSSCSSSSFSRHSSIRRSLDRCSLVPAEAISLFSGSAWAVEGNSQFGGAATSTICSDLVGSASQQLQQQLPTYAAGEATASLGLSELQPQLNFVDNVINETHLLQVAAVLGEASARGALAAREAGGPIGHPSSFYGSPDTLEHTHPWELLVSEGTDSLLYWGWRKPLRKGLHMYMTRSLFLGASPAEVRAFMMDDAYRVVWDHSMAGLRPVPHAAACSSSSAASSERASNNAAVEAMAAATAARLSVAVNAEHDAKSKSNMADAPEPSVLPHENALMQALVQFPKPMANRSYLYARRVWPRPADGGCYCLSKACTAPLDTSIPPLPGRSVSVDDFSSGCVIRTPNPELLPPGADPNTPAAEVFLVYFEDSHVRSSLANLGIKKGLWPLVQRTEKALRVYQAGAAANLHLHVPSAACASSSTLDHSAQECASSSIDEASEWPPVEPISRSASVSCDFSSPATSLPAVALSRSKSMHEPADSLCRFPSASLPCFPVEIDSAPRVQDCCDVLGEPTVSAAACSSEPLCKQTCEQGSRGWGWIKQVGSAVLGAIKQSRQLLAAVSVVVWRSGPTVALVIPRFEWKVLTWAYHQLMAPRHQLLLGPSAGSRMALCGSSTARCPSSHPLREWVSQGVLRHLPSHPINPGDDTVQIAGNTQPILTAQSAPVLQLRLAYTAHVADSANGSSRDSGSAAGSCVASTAGSDVASFSLSCSSCGCCCGGRSSASSSASSRRCSRSAGNCCSSSSIVRDESGGRRHRRVMVKLVQTAGLRVARRVARMAGITE